MKQPKHARTTSYSLPSALIAMFAMSLGLVVAFGLLRNCATSTPQETPLRSASGGRSFYDPSCFVRSDGRFAYQSGSLSITKTGVDVSDHQGQIDWQAVADDGISFAFIRAGYRGNTEGRIHADTMFEQNLAGARQAGLECGVYFFSQAISADEAREEATYVLDLLGSRKLEYPIVFDYELNDGNRIAGVDASTATACARAFCDTIIAGGYEPMLYGNAYDLRPLDLSQLYDCQVWYAEYNEYPSRTDAFTIWQYSEAGSVNGINSSADLNLDLSEALETM